MIKWHLSSLLDVETSVFPKILYELTCPNPFGIRLNLSWSWRKHFQIAIPREKKAPVEQWIGVYSSKHLESMLERDWNIIIYLSNSEHVKIISGQRFWFDSLMYVCLSSVTVTVTFTFLILHNNFYLYELRSSFNKFCFIGFSFAI